jgi:uncharacterized membrane protein
MHLAPSLVGRVTELAVTAAPTSCSAMSRGDPGAVMASLAGEIRRFANRPTFADVLSSAHKEGYEIMSFRRADRKCALGRHLLQ